MTMTLSIEAVIAIIGVIVSLPPAVLALRELMRSKEAKATIPSGSDSPYQDAGHSSVDLSTGSPRRTADKLRKHEPDSAPLTTLSDVSRVHIR